MIQAESEEVVRKQLQALSATKDQHDRAAVEWLRLRSYEDGRISGAISSSEKTSASKDGGFSTVPLSLGSLTKVIGYR